MFGIHRNFPAGGGGTGDATAEQWDIKNGKTAYIAAGKVTGSGYFPAMMEFDGSTGYYSKTGVTTSGNKVTAIGRFTASPVAASQIIFYQLKSAARLLVAVVSSADGSNPNCLWLRCQNSSSTTICQLYSDITVTDGSIYTFLVDYDGDAGTATMTINGSDADNAGATGRTLTTGTLDSGASTLMGVGASNAGTSKFSGTLGFCGMGDIDGLTYSDFFQSDNSPKNVESTLSTVWASTPLFWNEHGDMVNNLGSAGAMTKNGTINVAAASSWS